MGDSMFTGDGNTGTENVTVHVEGEPQVIDEQTTAQELKEIAGAGEKEILTFRQDNQVKQIDDEKRVLDYAEAGTKFEFQPVGSKDGDGGLFG